MTEIGIAKKKKKNRKDVMERFPTFISWKVKGYEILSALKASGPLRVKGISPASMQKQTLRPLLIVKNSLS